MNLAISNIAWAEEFDEEVYSKLHNLGIDGLEIAPTRIFKDKPYDHIDEAIAFSKKLKKKYGLSIPSMQSIWYGKSEKIWGEATERDTLRAYTKKAIDFASAIGCGNLVFGCPRNRVMPEKADIDIAIDFFKELGDYAYEKNTCIGMEANPTIYNTNFLNTTMEAIDFIKRVDSKGFKLNLDLGTMIYNDEKLDILEGSESLINHVHISEPGLVEIEHRKIHQDVFTKLRDINYNGYVSIEMSTKKIPFVYEVILYLKELDGERK